VTTLALSTLWTLVAALSTIVLGRRINGWIPWLDRNNVPPSVSAGLVLSLALAGLRAAGIIEVKFAMEPRDALLLVFFASLGFGAHLGRLASAGKGALVICLAVLLAIVGQNLVGTAVATLFGKSALLGPFLGSIAYLGGHGTAVAWSNTPAAASVPAAFPIGIGSATLGLVLGGLTAGPIAVWLARRKGSLAAPAQSAAADEPGAAREPAFSSDRWLPCLMWILIAMALGPFLGALAAKQGLQVPGFLAVLLVAVAITNIADVIRRPLDTEITDLVGTIALRIFLAIAMLSLDWATLVAYLPMLATAAVAQVTLMAAIAVLVLYPLFGRDREAAAAAGGFIGFGLGAMPVGLAVMRRLNTRFGDTPRALLAVTLAASLFTDTANALVVNAFLGWLARY
jgi:ESS family glutamate:Na+ symporter